MSRGLVFLELCSKSLGLRPKTLATSWRPGWRIPKSEDAYSGCCLPPCPGIFGQFFTRWLLKPLPTMYSYWTLSSNFCVFLQQWYLMCRQRDREQLDAMLGDLLQAAYRILTASRRWAASVKKSFFVLFVVLFPIKLFSFDLISSYVWLWLFYFIFIKWDESMFQGIYRDFSYIHYLLLPSWTFFFEHGQALKKKMHRSNSFCCHNTKIWK
jgi:hypothetical protein